MGVAAVKGAKRVGHTRARRDHAGDTRRPVTKASTLAVEWARGRAS